MKVTGRFVHFTLCEKEREAQDREETLYLSFKLWISTVEIEGIQFAVNYNKDREYIQQLFDYEARKCIPTLIIEGKTEEDFNNLNSLPTHLNLSDKVFLSFNVNIDKLKLKEDKMDRKGNVVKGIYKNRDAVYPGITLWGTDDNFNSLFILEERVNNKDLPQISGVDLYNWIRTRELPPSIADAIPSSITEETEASNELIVEENTLVGA